MTGYGRGECIDQGYRLVVEINSVNRKQLEFAISLPREFDAMEGQLKALLGKFLSRGRIQVRVQLSDLEGNDCGVPKVNDALAEACVASLQEVAARINAKTEVSLELLTRIPGVIKISPKTPNPDDIWILLESAAKQAVEGLLTMRTTEGNHLHTDLSERIENMRNALSIIKGKAAELPTRHRKLLIERLEKAGIDQIDVHDERILKELVLFADKSDITEEITRLESHFSHFKTLCDKQQQVGRSLDFLSQEMFREINTIGSKASNHEIAHIVVSLKTELEKFREQVQNLE
ncbi:MAG: YicC family protein [Verrucomicrobiota bacterium]|jgi:uncharacterized protein (TIGR00255 family)|nr:YicC family protein [Verrucomicrobiota bacterium]